MQVAPFLHGLDWHSSMSISHCRPSKPLTHTQVNSPIPSRQVPPFWHGSGKNHQCNSGSSKPHRRQLGLAIFLLGAFSGKKKRMIQFYCKVQKIFEMHELSEMNGTCQHHLKTTPDPYARRHPIWSSLIPNTRASVWIISSVNFGNSPHFPSVSNASNFAKFAKYLLYVDLNQHLNGVPLSA